MKFLAPSLSPARLALLLTLHTPLAAQQAATWNHPNQSGDWDDELQWSPVGVPSGNYHATITAGTVTIGTPVTIAQFTLENGAALGGSSLTTTGTLTMNGGRLESGLVVQANGDVDFANDGNATVRAAFTNAAGSTAVQYGSGPIILEGGGVLVNRGTFIATKTGGITSGAGPGTFENHGSFRCNTFTLFTGYNIALPFNNHAGPGVSIIQSKLSLFAGTCAGPVALTDGTLELLGAYTLAAGTTVTGTGTLTVNTQNEEEVLLATALTTPAYFLLHRGTLRLAAGVNFTSTGSGSFTGGKLAGAGTLVVQPELRFLNQSGINAATLFNPADGTVTLEGSLLDLSNGAKIVNEGPWEVVTTGVVNGTGGAHFDNSAGAEFTVGRSSGSAVVATLRLPFHNEGTVTVLPAPGDGGSQDLFIEGGGVSPGRFVVGAGSQLAFSTHEFAATSTLEGAGDLVFFGNGAQTVPASLNIDTGSFALVTSTVLMAADAELRLRGNSYYLAGAIRGGDVIADSNGTSGTMSLNETSFTVSSGYTLELEASRQLGLSQGTVLVNRGTFKAGAGSVITGTGGGNQVFNRGTFLTEGAAGTRLVLVPFNNHGTVQVKAGKLELAGGGTSGELGPPPVIPGGAFIVDAGATLKFSTNYTLGAGTSFDGAGTVDFDFGATSILDSLDLHGLDLNLDGGATLSLPANKLLLSKRHTTVTRGTVTGGGTVKVAGDCSITGPLSVQGGSTFATAPGSTTTYSAPQPIALAGGFFDNNGLFNITGPGGFSGTSGGKLNNYGFLSQEATSVFIMTTTLNNPGKLRVSAGTFQLSPLGSIVQFDPITKTLTGGSYEVDAGATLVLPGPIESLGGEVLMVGLNCTFHAVDPLFATLSSGAFGITEGRDWDTAGDFLNEGLLSIGPDSTFNATGTFLSLGRVSLNGGTLHAAQPIQVQGGSLSGSGNVEGSVVVSGAAQISPGSSIGTLAVTGPYTQTGGTLTFEFGRTITATADQLTATGALSLTNSTITLQLLPGSAPLQVGDALTVLQSTAGLTLSGVSIVFDPSLGSYAFTQQQTANGLTFTITKAPPALAVTAWQLTPGNQVQLDFSVTPVPAGVGYTFETSTTGLAPWTTLNGAVLQPLASPGHYRYTAARAAAPAALYRVRVSY